MGGSFLLLSERTHSHMLTAVRLHRALTASTWPKAGCGYSQPGWAGVSAGTSVGSTQGNGMGIQERDPDPGTDCHKALGSW